MAKTLVKNKYSLIEYILVAKLYVVQAAFRCLLSCDTAVKLKLLNLANQITHENISYDQICDKYPKLFTDICKQHIDDSVKPAAIPHRLIPFHLRQKVEAELTYLKDNDIIEKIDDSTPRVSPIVTPL